MHARSTERWKTRGWTICLATVAVGMALAVPAWSGEADEWDHRQMRSRYRPLVEPKPARTGVEGETRFGQIRRGAVAEAPTRVPAQLDHMSQRAWEGTSGGPSQDTSLFPPGSSHRVGAIGRNKTNNASQSGSGRGSRSGRMN